MTAFIRVWAKACNALTRKTTTQTTNFAELKLFFLGWNSEYRSGIGPRRRLNREACKLSKLITASLGQIFRLLFVGRRQTSHRSRRGAYKLVIYKCYFDTRLDAPFGHDGARLRRSLFSRRSICCWRHASHLSFATFRSSRLKERSDFSYFYGGEAGNRERR